MDDAAIEAHLAKLRQLYVEATPLSTFTSLSSASPTQPTVPTYW